MLRGCWNRQTPPDVSTKADGFTCCGTDICQPAGGGAIRRRNDVVACDVETSEPERRPQGRSRDDANSTANPTADQARCVVTMDGLDENMSFKLDRRIGGATAACQQFSKWRRIASCKRTRRRL